MVEKRVIPIGDVETGSIEGVQGQHLTTVAEGVQSGNRDDSRDVMCGFLGGSLDMLDDSGLEHRIENEPVQFKTRSEEGGLRLTLQRLSLVMVQKM